MIVSRTRFEEMKTFLTARIVELEAERKRLHDLVYSHQFGEQVFDSLPVKPVAAAPVPQPVAEEREPSPQEAEEQRLAEVRASLAALKHGQVSKLGPALARVMNNETLEAAKRANPAAFGIVRQEVAAHFEQATRKALQH